MKLIANKTVLFILEAVFVIFMLAACMSLTVKEASAMEYTTDGEAVSGYEYYDAKTGTYVSEKQYMVYSFIDLWIKKVGLAVAVISLVGGFVFRRIDKVNAVFRAKALRLEIGVPTLYILVAYVVCYYADRFV